MKKETGEVIGVLLTIVILFALISSSPHIMAIIILIAGGYQLCTWGSILGGKFIRSNNDKN